MVIGQKRNPQDDLNTMPAKNNFLIPSRLQAHASKSKSPNIQQRSKRFKKEKSSLSKFVSKGGHLMSSGKGKSLNRKIVLKPLEKKSKNLNSQEKGPREPKYNIQKIPEEKIESTEKEVKTSLKYPKDYVYEISNQDVKREGRDVCGV
jgi:hypothetical protein